MNIPSEEMERIKQTMRDWFRVVAPYGADELHRYVQSMIVLEIVLGDKSDL
jgi:hypothetical protein